MTIEPLLIVFPDSKRSSPIQTVQGVLGRAIFASNPSRVVERFKKVKQIWIINLATAWFTPAR